MTMDAGRVFQRSYERVMEALGSDFFGDFYDRLLGSSPPIKEKFARTDMRRQQQVLRGSFFHLLNYYYTQPTCNEVMEGLIESHGPRGYNVSPEMYEMWLETMVETARRHDPEYSPEIESAWREVFSAGINRLKQRK